MPILKDEIIRIARLSRLNLPPVEHEKLSKDLSVILDYVNQLKSVDTQGIKPYQPLLWKETILREDKPGPSLFRQEALSNAPETDGEFFIVPRVIG